MYLLVDKCCSNVMSYWKKSWSFAVETYSALEYHGRRGMSTVRSKVQYRIHNEPCLAN